MSKAERFARATREAKQLRPRSFNFGNIRAECESDGSLSIWATEDGNGGKLNVFDSLVMDLLAWMNETYGDGDRMYTTIESPTKDGAE